MAHMFPSGSGFFSLAFFFSLSFFFGCQKKMVTESKVKEINLMVGLLAEGSNEIQRYFKRKPKVICGHPTPPLPPLPPPPPPPPLPFKTFSVIWIPPSSSSFEVLNSSRVSAISWKRWKWMYQDSLQIDKIWCYFPHPPPPHPPGALFRMFDCLISWAVTVATAICRVSLGSGRNRRDTWKWTDSASLGRRNT